MCQHIAETLLLIKNILEPWWRMGLKSQTKEQKSSKVESWGFLDKSLRSVMTYMLWFSYNWFKFCFCLFQTHYHTCMLPYPKTKGNRIQIKIKLNQNIYNLVCLRQKMWIFWEVWHFQELLRINLKNWVKVGSGFRVEISGSKHCIYNTVKLL